MNTLTRRSFFLLPVLPFLAKVKMDPLLANVKPTPKVIILRPDVKAMTDEIIKGLRAMGRLSEELSRTYTHVGNNARRMAETMGKVGGKLGETSGKSG